MTAQPIHSPAAMREAVRKALRLYHKDSREGAPLRPLRLFQQLRPSCRNDRQAVNQILTDAVATLTKEHPEEAAIIVANHFDGLTMKEVAHKIGLGEAATYDRKARGIEWLTEIIWAAEKDAGKRDDGQDETRADDFPLFPRAEEPVVGIEKLVDRLWETVERRGSPYIFALVGMGGIGKTTLAQVLVRRLSQADAIVDAAWVSAKPSSFAVVGMAPTLRPALTAEAAVESLHRQLVGAVPGTPFSYKLALGELREKLKGNRYVVVIDNLETVQDFETLLPLVQELAEPSKVIFTTRDSLLGSLGVHHFAVPPLDEADSLYLLRSHASNAGLTHFREMDDDELRPVFEAVGGNPLALRLVVGQSHLHDLDYILRDLTGAKGKAAELYEYVFRRAWNNLDRSSRIAWLATPTLPATGGTHEQWLRASTLSDEEFDRALEQLVTFNLVDKRLSPHASLYSIHSLARTFLLNGIAGWL